MDHDSPEVRIISAWIDQLTTRQVIGVMIRHRWEIIRRGRELADGWLLIQAMAHQWQTIQQLPDEL